MHRRAVRWCCLVEIKLNCEYEPFTVCRIMPHEPDEPVTQYFHNMVVVGKHFAFLLIVV